MAENIEQLSEIRERFAAELEERLVAYVSRNLLLERMAKYHLDTGGKRLRAFIPPWVCHNLGGDGADALDFGVGLELIHNGTLVHDDVQDGDEWRRGQLALWRRWGVAQAINVGDALYFWGIESIARGPDGAIAVSHVTHSVVGTITGQVMEFQLRPDAAELLEPSMQSWVRTATAKTGALFGACVACGVIAAGIIERDALTAAQQLGEAIGLIFQVQDDFLDLVGDKGRDRPGSDLREGKLSFPVAWCYENATEDVAQRLRAIVESPREDTSDAMVDEGVALLDGSGSIEATAQWLRQMEQSIGHLRYAETVPGIVEKILAPVAHRL